MKTLSILLTILLFLIQDISAQEQLHRVRSGETLFSISRQYDVSVSQLREWNNISNNQIEIDQVLIVRKSSEKINEDSKRTHQSELKTHRVLRGETLFSISRNYEVSVQDLMEWNNLQSTSISVGQFLYVEMIEETPATESVFEEVEKSTIDSDVEDPENGNDEVDELPELTPITRSINYYIVEPGDTMYRIARSNNMTVDELKELNNLETSTLEVGDRILLRSFRTPPSVLTSRVSSTPQGAFITHSISEDENLLDILTHYRMDRYEFSALNPEKRIDDLRPGDKVVLLVPTTNISSNPYRIKNSIKGVEEIKVSAYSSSEKAQTLTSGDLYNPNMLTAAHPNLPLGTTVFIENPENSKGTFVLINDRITGSTLKLSYKAFKTLGYTGADNQVAIIYE